MNKFFVALFDLRTEERGVKWRCVAISYPKIVIKIHRHVVYMFVAYDFFEPTSQINRLRLMLKISFIKLNTHTEHSQDNEKTLKRSLCLSPFGIKTLTIYDHCFDNKIFTRSLFFVTIYLDAHTKTNASLIFIMYWIHIRKKFTCFYLIRNKNSFSPFGSTVHVNCSFDRVHHFHFVVVVTLFFIRYGVCVLVCFAAFVFPRARVVRFTMWFYLFLHSSSSIALLDYVICHTQTHQTLAHKSTSSVVIV